MVHCRGGERVLLKSRQSHFGRKWMLYSPGLDCSSFGTFSVKKKRTGMVLDSDQGKVKGVRGRGELEASTIGQNRGIEIRGRG